MVFTSLKFFSGNESLNLDTAIFSQVLQQLGSRM